MPNTTPDTPEVDETIESLPLGTFEEITTKLAEIMGVNVEQLRREVQKNHPKEEGLWACDKNEDGTFSIWKHTGVGYVIGLDVMTQTNPATGVKTPVTIPIFIRRSHHTTADQERSADTMTEERERREGANVPDTTRADILRKAARACDLPGETRIDKALLPEQ